MIVHQIEALVAAGVKDVVLAVNYRPEIMEKFLADVRNLSRLPLNWSPSPLVGWSPLEPALTVSYSMRRSTTSTSNSRSSLSPSIPLDP